MTCFEKIKAMDVDELAEFIVSASEYGGLYDKVCQKCPYDSFDGRCLSKNKNQDCKDAVKFLLEQEVT